MASTQSASTTRGGSYASLSFLICASLIALLVLVQALLAGEWLAGHDVINVHAAIGLLIVVLAASQFMSVAVQVHGDARRGALITTGLFILLAAVQVVLGYGGFDSANQARALHLPTGLILFGLAGGNAMLARRTRQ